MRNSPGFAVVAIATIALAIGANSAMFSFVNGVFLRPLPYPEPDRIVRVLERLPTGGATGISTLNYLDWQTQNTVFEHIAAEVAWRATLTGGEEAIAIRGARVSAAYFDIFGAKAALGRTFLPGEDSIGNDRVVLLSHVLWENRFGSDPTIVGQPIALDGDAHTVVGILEEGAFDRAAAQVYKPLAFQPSNMTRGFRWLGATAKLKPGVTLERARAEMAVISQRLAAAYPDSNREWGTAVDRLADVVVDAPLRTAVAVLFGATALVLLIGCANLASLALARGISRQREMAVRAALGANRWRLVALVLTETAVIALCGGIAGAVVGYGVLQWILSLIPPYALPPALDVRMDSSDLLFALIAAVVTALLFGLTPAVQSASTPLVDALKEGGPSTSTSGRSRRAHSRLVILEIALAVVLLVAAGLLLRSVVNLLNIDPGFRASDVLTAGLPVNRARHPDPRELNAYLASISGEIGSVPGATGVALTSALPLQGWGYGVPYTIADREVGDPTSRRRAFFKIVSPSYFNTLDIKLLAGRLLGDQDIAAAPPVAVINHAFASREFPDDNPIGRRIVVPEIVPGTTQFGKEIVWTIVGVIAGEKVTGLGDEISAGLYVSNLQSPAYDLHLVVRADVVPQSLQRAVRAAVDRVDKDQALSDVRSLEQIVQQSMLGNRVMSTLLAVFASLALLLAALGIYGVVSYNAAQRTYEMGIRAALGASAGNLRNLILKGGMRLTLIGVAVGLAATLPATDVISSMLYGVGRYDPMTMSSVAGLVVGVAAFACWLPARRLANADPIEALRAR